MKNIEKCFLHKILPVFIWVGLLLMMICGTYIAGTLMAEIGVQTLLIFGVMLLGMLIIPFKFRGKRVLYILIWVALSLLITFCICIMQGLVGFIGLEAFWVWAVMLIGMFIASFKCKNSRIKWALYPLVFVIFFIFLIGIVIGLRMLFFEEFSKACDDRAAREYCGDCFYIGNVNNVFTGCSLYLRSFPGGG